MTPRKGRLVVISGPSGSGKTSIIDRLREHPQVEVSVSVTTRPPRPGEVHGHHYEFVSRARFDELQAQDAFVETNDVFGVGNLYGSRRDALDRALAIPGRVYLMEVDVVGARNIRRAGYDGVQLFIRAPSREVLERRLRARGTDDEAAIGRRLARAEAELAEATADGAEIIVNQRIEDAVEQILRRLQLPSQPVRPARPTNH